MSISVREDGDDRAIIAPGLALWVRWRDDRWRHTLAIEGGGWVRSVEDDGGPAYQQLDIQATGDAEATALMVGQAGPHHFAGTFRVVTDRTGARLTVEVADRQSQPGPARALTCVYRLEFPGWTLSESQPHRAVWNDTRRHRPIVCAAGPEARLRIEATGPDSWDLHVQMEPGPDPEARTLRCSYSWG